MQPHTDFCGVCVYRFMSVVALPINTIEADMLTYEVLVYNEAQNSATLRIWSMGK